MSPNQVSGAVPKQEFFKSEDTSSVGEIVYDEGEKKVISAKLAGVVSSWKEMMGEVDSRAAKGFRRGDRMEIQSILARDMTDLKLDMRRVSKVGRRPIKWQFTPSHPHSHTLRIWPLGEGWGYFLLFLV